MASDASRLQGAGGISLQSRPYNLQGSQNTIQVGAAPTSGTIQIGNAQKAVNQNNAYLQSAQAQNASLQKQISSLLASLRPVNPAPIDIASINAQARKQAEEAVNPRYTKALNDMLAKLSVQRSRAQQDYTSNIENLDEQLKQTQEGNAITGARTAEDVANQTGQINNAEDQFQQLSGTEFDNARLAEAQQLAASGLTTSGIGRQQARNTVDQSNLSEKAQGEEFQNQRTAQAVLKARTFEDLARSDVLAGQATEKGKGKAKLDLDRLIEDVNREEEASRFDIESQRLADIASQSQGYAKVAFNNYLAGIRDPRILQATANAYGGLF